MSAVLTAGLANLNSYKVAITVAGQPVYTGTVVTKPVLSRDLTVQGGTRIVVIGNEAWVGAGRRPAHVGPGGDGDRPVRDV